MKTGEGQPKRLLLTIADTPSSPDWYSSSDPANRARANTIPAESRRRLALDILGIDGAEEVEGGVVFLVAAAAGKFTGDKDFEDVGTASAAL